MVTPSSSRSWLQQQQALSTSCEALFDHHAGDEAGAFLSMMELLHECFEEGVLRKLNTVKDKAAIGMVGQAYQLLVSCWEDLRRGRATAALNHWRSLWELPDYIIAAALDATFAERWSDRAKRNHLRADDVRSLAVLQLNRIQAGEGNKWEARRTSEKSTFQPLSHVSSQAAGLVFLTPGPNSAGNFFSPEGYYHPTLRTYAVRTALLAMDLLMAAVVSLAPFLEESWHERTLDALWRSQEAIDGVLAELKSNGARPEEAGEE